jgi:sulfatase maturation enzyme AslB (radical SAM superfamily)
MENVKAIKLTNPESFMITWDIGRRCNFDCSYCESTRHNTYSPPTDFDSLKKTFKFIQQYVSLYKFRQVNLSFTGGEPTVNPQFWNLISYIKKNSNFGIGITSNGTWHPKHTNFILENCNGITISWHAESNQKLRTRAIENAIRLHSAGIWTSVNVMLHTDFWKESVNAYNKLKLAGVNAVPTLLGDGTIDRTEWFKDQEGSWRRTGHSYTPEQREWFYKEKNISVGQINQLVSGAKMGRSCCGGRCLQGKVNDTWKPVSVVDNHFKDWFCTINYYFLHIEEHTKNIYHHQTCQATFTGKGPIGNLDNIEVLLENTKKYLSNPTPIVCPNTRCGCGMCVPKAKEWEDFVPMWNLVSAGKD